MERFHSVIGVHRVNQDIRNLQNCVWKRLVSSVWVEIALTYAGCQQSCCNLQTVTVLAHRGVPDLNLQ
mgnify:CR=1 FL=1